MALGFGLGFGFDYLSGCKTMKAEQYAPNYHRFTIPINSTDKVPFFVSSDWHFDNPKCNRKLLFKHLDMIKEKNGYIIVTGDLFCLMQGKYDKRSSKSDILPQHMQNNYLDAVIDEAIELLAPYAHNMLLISKGNHETSVSSRNETDVLKRLVDGLNIRTGSNIQLGQYTGYYTLCFNYRGKRKSLQVGYSHGNWGGIITKGTLSVVRYSAIMPDCDVMFSGHTHDGWIVTQPRLRRNEYKQKVEVVNQWHIKTGTYKEEFENGKGWAVERIAMPKHIGGCLMNVDINHEAIKPTFTLL